VLSFPQNAKGNQPKSALWVALIFCAAFLLFNLSNPLFYDDAFISMRIARNFVEGKGLYHNLEEKVQTNTSLLYPLLTAPMQLFSQDTAPKAVMAFDFILFFLSILLISQFLSRVSNVGKLPIPWQVFVYSLLNFALYTGRVLTPGMETQLYLLFISATFFLNLPPARKTIIQAFSTFCRPEGSLLFWSGLAGRISRSSSLKKTLAESLLPISGLLVSMLIGWLYYQSAIPHTILVKQCLKPVFSESVWYFFRQVLFDTQYLFISVLQAIGIWFIWKNRKQKIVFEVALYLGFYVLFFTFGPGWNRFFGWYQMPVKFLLTLFAVWQIVQWCLSGYGKTILIFFGILALPEAKQYLRMSTYRQDGIRKAGHMLAGLSGGQPFVVTCEPIGFLSYYAMNCRFRDYPGLASGISLEILRKEGPIRVKNYFENPAFQAIIRKSGAHLVLLSRPEYRSFKSMMDSEFRFICRIGQYSDSEFNSEFLVFGNPANLSSEKIRELQARALRLGYPSGHVP
jgi:hypothetical protein